MSNYTLKQWEDEFNKYDVSVDSGTLQDSTDEELFDLLCLVGGIRAALSFKRGEKND